MSHVTCGACTQVVGCAWCPSPGVEGAPHCNLESSWVVTIPIRHYTITENTSFVEWVVPKLLDQQQECKEQLHKDRSMVPKEVRKFYTTYGNKFDPERNFNYDYSMPLKMNVGRNYEFQLKWYPRNQEPANSFQNLLLTLNAYPMRVIGKPHHIKLLISRNFEYKVDYREDHVLFNISMELSKCPEAPINWVNIFVQLEQEGMKNPIGVFALNIQTVCHCECQEANSVGFEQFSAVCNGGNLECGVCKQCPEGSFGESCKCTTGDELLKFLPSIEIGTKDDLVEMNTKQSMDTFSFDHAIRPLKISPKSVQCNSTYCKNVFSEESDQDGKFDLANRYSLVALYADHRLLPGAELEFRFTTCEVDQELGRYQWATRFGFGVPVSKIKRRYPVGILKQATHMDLMKYWSDDPYFWAAFNLGKLFYLHKNFYNDNSRADENKDYISEWEGPSNGKSFPLDENSSVKLAVTDTAVVWSWDGFSFTHTINILEKHYYPLFFLHGCKDKREFTTVKIIKSKTGNL